MRVRGPGLEVPEENPAGVGRKRIVGLRANLAAAGAGLAKDSPLARSLAEFDGKVDAPCASRSSPPPRAAQSPAKSA
jgi:hypothetical protein